MRITVTVAIAIALLESFTLAVSQVRAALELNSLSILVRFCDIAFTFV